MRIAVRNSVARFVKGIGIRAGHAHCKMVMPTLAGAPWTLEIGLCSRVGSCGTRTSNGCASLGGSCANRGVLPGAAGPCSCRIHAAVVPAVERGRGCPHPPQRPITGITLLLICGTLFYMIALGWGIRPVYTTQTTSRGTRKQEAGAASESPTCNRLTFSRFAIFLGMLRVLVAR